MSAETKQYEQDACFYVWSNDYEIVWQDSTLPDPRFYVARNGEMRIHARKELDAEYQVLRYTDDLRDFGINTDDDLRAWEAKGEQYFIWDNNPWFEVCSRKDGDQDLNEVYHELDEAIAQAEILWKHYGANGDLWKDGE
jgi:hypothetical protein